MTDLSDPAPTGPNGRAVGVALGLVAALVALATLALGPLTTVAGPSAGPPAASTLDDAMTVTAQRSSLRRRTARIARRLRLVRTATRPATPARRDRLRWAPPAPARNRPPTWRGPPALLAA